MLVNSPFNVAAKDMFRSLQKTKLIEHYIESLGAVHFGGHLMVITTDTALKLINKYF
jgi:hypothetical protein